MDKELVQVTKGDCNIHFLHFPFYNRHT